MRWKSYCLLLAVGCFLLATAFKHFFVNFKPKGGPRPSFSSVESKKNGVWLCDMKLDPNSVRLGDTDYALGDAWIEEVTDEDYCLVWFPCRSRLGRNRLCFAVPEGSQLDITVESNRERYGNILYVFPLKSGEFPTQDVHVTCRVGDESKEFVVTLAPKP